MKSRYLPGFGGERGWQIRLISKISPGRTKFTLSDNDRVKPEMLHQVTDEVRASIDFHTAAIALCHEANVLRDELTTIANYSKLLRTQDAIDLKAELVGVLNHIRLGILSAKSF